MCRWFGGTLCGCGVLFAMAFFHAQDTRTIVIAAVLVSAVPLLLVRHAPRFVAWLSLGVLAALPVSALYLAAPADNFFSPREGECGMASMAALVFLPIMQSLGTLTTVILFWRSQRWTRLWQHAEVGALALAVVLAGLAGFRVATADGPQAADLSPPPATVLFAAVCILCLMLPRAVPLARLLGRRVAAHEADADLVEIRITRTVILLVAATPLLAAARAGLLG